MDSRVVANDHIRTARGIRIGSVSYLNAKPLIYGLDEASDLRLTLDVPSRLLEGLRDGRFDVALLPIIDYQRLEGLRILTCGGIGCDGPTLTVRIFSRVPIEKIESLACDADSHTSVALARVILAEAFGLHPEFSDLKQSAAAEKMQALLLIGDKVVCEEPVGYEYQLDLGEAWKKLTGLPFVFAAWIARNGVALGDLPDRLAAAKQSGLKNVEKIVRRYGEPRGWPKELARRYLTEFLKYDIGPAQILAIERFFELAGQHGIVSLPTRGLVVER